MAATAAAARARTGAEIVNLTYRSHYVEDPSGQWQGYQDSNTNRAWGLAEWGSRAGQGAFFDWVAANALLPAVDTNPAHTGIQKIDRTTVTELRQVAAAFAEIQNKVDQADMGLNPLGLVKNVVPFDLDPTLIQQGKTHFEQIYDRAVQALNNAITVFNYANNSTQLLRRQADSQADFQKTVADREADFKSRLVETFGYPYGDDIGALGAYPAGYDGPDIYHYDYIDSSPLLGETPPPSQTLTVSVKELVPNRDGSLSESNRQVAFNISSRQLGLVKPANWTQPRRAPGEIQMARSDLLQTYGRFQKALVDYNNSIAAIEDFAAFIKVKSGYGAEDIRIMMRNRDSQMALNDDIFDARTTEQKWLDWSKTVMTIADATAEALPKEVGFSFDPSFCPPRRDQAGRCVWFARVRQTGFRVTTGPNAVSARQGSRFAAGANRTGVNRNWLNYATDLQQLAQMLRSQSSQRLELFSAGETLTQAAGRYSAALARGLRVLEDQLRFRQETAAQIQAYRYKDMAFRIFRNDALQKYRAQFDLAAMYVYLAARAYDYETNLRENDPRGPGMPFMTGIIRSRSLGVIENGLPQTGSGTGDPGLSDPMARMSLNWNLVLDGQLGFNQPQTETGRFSLRSELFRIQSGAAGSRVWRETLTRNVVPNLLELPEFKRYCSPVLAATASRAGDRHPLRHVH